MKIFRILVLLPVVIMSCNMKTNVNEDNYKLDQRYAPIWGQTSICLPDEVQKTIVDDKGTIYYDYTNSNWKVFGPFNGFNISMNAGLDSVESVEASQHLYSPKVPVLITAYEKDGIHYSTNIFAVAPALKISAGDSCELSKGYMGYPHNDIILFTIKNTLGKDASVVPEFIVKSVYPVKISKDKIILSIDKRI